MAQVDALRWYHNGQFCEGSRMKEDQYRAELHLWTDLMCKLEELTS